MKQIIFLLTVLTLILVVLPKAQAVDKPTLSVQPDPGESTPRS